MANFPHERSRLIESIRESGAMHTVLLSGDRHLGEISRLPGTGDAFPLYENKASGLNSVSAGEGEQNRYRVTNDNVRVDHFGTVRLVMEAVPYVELGLHDVDGAVAQRFRIDYATWQPLVPWATCPESRVYAIGFLRPNVSGFRQTRTRQTAYRGDCLLQDHSEVPSAPFFQAGAHVRSAA